jgi:hypothetical protein
VKCAGISRPHFLNGRRRYDVELYEDDLVAQVRRVVRVQVYYNGVAKRPAPHGHQLEVFHAYGYNAEKHVWGDGGSKTAYRELEPKEAQTLLDTAKAWILANLHPYLGGPNYYAKVFR